MCVAHAVLSFHFQHCFMSFVWQEIRVKVDRFTSPSLQYKCLTYTWLRGYLRLKTTDSDDYTKKKNVFHHTLNLNIYYFHHLLQNLTERFWPVHFSEHAQCSGTVKCEAHLNRFTWFGSLGFQVFFFNISSS